MGNEISRLLLIAMNKLLTLCTPLIESGDFYAGAKGEKTGPISREYLTDVLKCYIDKTDSLYSKILSLVTKPAEDIPDDHQPVIKLLKYNAGAKADMHYDACTYGTSIILLDSSSDLQGGETCIKTDKFEIVDMKSGDHIFHPKGRLHGVTKLTKGYRHVLVLVW